MCIGGALGRYPGGFFNFCQEIALWDQIGPGTDLPADLPGDLPKGNLRRMAAGARTHTCILMHTRLGVLFGGVARPCTTIQQANTDQPAFSPIRCLCAHART